MCAGDKIFAELACFFSCVAFFLIYYFIGQPILTLFMVSFACIKRLDVTLFFIF